MENETVSVIGTTSRTIGANAANDGRQNEEKQPDEKEKDDSGVKLPERDLVMNRPPAGQAPDPSEQR
jgi:hypothetical protein